MITKNQVKKILLVLIIFFSISISFASESFAADISFDIPSNINVGDIFEVYVYADTDGQSINSLDITVGYPTELVFFSGYKTEGSVVRMWISPPGLKEETIYFSGIIPGGVSGQYDANKEEISSVPVTRLLFMAKKQGTGKLTFIKTEILKNDGKGTPIPFEQKDTELTINDSEKGGIDKPLSDGDTTPPEDFEITFLESFLSPQTPSMIIFQGSDAGSGIKQYQIKIGTSAWQDATSPYPVSKAFFSRNLSVRATDYNGNFKDSSLKIPGFIPSKLLWITLLLLVSGIWGYKLIKYKS